MAIEQAISIVAGVILSIVLQTIPSVENWWNQRRGKVLILLIVHVGGALLLWLLECKANVSTGVQNIVCNWEGLGQLGWTGTLGFAANQAAYGLTNYTQTGKDITLKIKSFNTGVIQTLRIADDKDNHNG